MEDCLYTPQIVRIIEVISEARDIKTFLIENTNNSIVHKPGQFAILTPFFGYGEFAASISSSPFKKDTLEFSIKRVGLATEMMHKIGPGDEIGIRGPYGRAFPMDELEGRNLIFIGGGLGLAPLRSVINTVFAQRDRYNRIYILYGARTEEDIIYKNELFNLWRKEDATVVCTIDRILCKEWPGRIGLITALMDYVHLPIEGTKVITCGPVIMIKAVLAKLKMMGYSPFDIITTLERKMKCGIGKCGRCNLGQKYVCRDGPVFTLGEVEALLDEY